MLNYPQESLKSSDGDYSNSIQATNVSKQMYISEFTFTHEKRKIYPGKINYPQESMKSSNRNYWNSIQATNVSKQIYISEFTFTHERRKICVGKSK